MKEEKLETMEKVSLEDLYDDDTLDFKESEELRPSFFRKMVSWLGRLLPMKQKAPEINVDSRFREFIQNMDREDDMYESAQTASDLCDDCLKIVRQRMILADQLKDSTEKILELECYMQLSEEDARHLKNLLDGFVSLSKERNGLVYQLVEFDSSLTQMKFMEEEAQDAEPMIEDAEKSQRILRRDIGYIEGEKADLKYEQGVLESGLNFINKFSVVMVVLFAIVTLYLGYLYMLKDTSIFFPTTALILCAIVVITLLYTFQKRMEYELKLNIKKQKRAVSLLNKKNVVFAYYTNFLNYEYNKYKVRSSRMLTNNLKDFKRYKHITARIDAVRKVMYETESQIEQFLREKNIAYNQFAIEQFAQTIHVDDKIDYSRQLMEKKNLLERKLQELDSRHEFLWDRLEKFNETDVSDEKVIAGMIQVYFDEVSRLFLNIDKGREAV